MIEEFDAWAKKVSENKKTKLDQNMFDEFIKQVRLRLEPDISLAQSYIKKYVDDGDHSMYGSHLMFTNAKVISQKLWSLKQGRIKVKEQ